MTNRSSTSASRWMLCAAVVLVLLKAAEAYGAANCDRNPNPQTPGECLFQVLPVVMSGPGSNGAFFRTSLKLVSQSYTFSGRLVFHPAGQAGTDSDPSLAFTLTSGELRTFSDVVEAIGASGLGSLDVLLSTPGSQPYGLSTYGFYAFSELYNDSIGRPGSTNELVTSVDPTSNPFYTQGSNILSLYYEGAVPVPNLEGRRLRLGVRTLDVGRPCEMLFELYGTGPRAHSFQTFPPNYFQQFDPASLFGVEPQEGQMISVRPNPSIGCPTIAYIVIADNVSNAPSIRLFHATTSWTF